MSAPVTELPALTEEERTLLEFWVRLGDLLGFTRSVGRIYGLIFARERGITADDCVALLGISRSSAGQGLKFLAELGAIRTEPSAIGRKESFQLEPDLGILVRNVLQRRLFPALNDLDHRLEAICEQLPAEGKLTNRVKKLQRWRDKASPLVVMLQTLSK